MRKDVNKPKGKTSAYAFFVQTCREEHRKKNPEQSVNFAEFSKKCSERWKALSPSDKKCFEDMAKADKVRYNREMRDYVPPKGFGKRGRKRKDPNRTAFWLWFCAGVTLSPHSENVGSNPSWVLSVCTLHVLLVWVFSRFFPQSRTMTQRFFGDSKASKCESLMDQ
uniref:High mobility group box 2b n=1 Tax=Oryzias sinensis TaxID=183150 RepID=A0A8C8DHA3_9TELE